MYQLDIFTDSVVVQHANLLIKALADFDSPRAAKALDALLLVDPNNTDLPHFKVLCDFVANWHREPLPADLGAIINAVQWIRERLIPSSVAIGHARESLINKCWLDLAKCSEAAGIDAAHPDYFAAELYLRARQAPDAYRMAQTISGASMSAAAQRWIGLAVIQKDAAAARRAALRYAWLLPLHFDELLNDMGDAALLRDWRSFQADLGDLDATWFPAWCVHEKKGGQLITSDFPSGNGPAAYRLVIALAERERAGLSPSLYKDRAHLKNLDENFFNFYMRRRTR